MNKCPFCQSENDEKSKFCSNCGGLLVNEPKDEAPLAEEPEKVIEPIQSHEDEWQTVGQPIASPGPQTTPPPPPPPGVPPQPSSFQQAPQGQAPFAPPPPPVYPAAPQSPQKSNKGLFIGLLVGGLLLLAVCITLILVFTRSLKKRVDEGAQIATWIINQVDEKSNEVLETMQAPSPTEQGMDKPADDPISPIEQSPSIDGFTEVLHETFGPESNFSPFQQEESEGYLRSNAYEIVVNKKNFIGWKTSGVVDAPNVLVQVDSERISAEDTDSYGLICRFVDYANYVEGEVFFDGWIMIRKYLNDEEVQLVSKRIQNVSGDKNTLTMACVDDVITLFVNGAQVAAVKDFSPMTGDVGLAVGNFTETKSSVSFTNLRAYEVETGTVIKTIADLPFEQNYTSRVTYENEGYVYQNDLLTEDDAKRIGFTDTEYHKVAWENGSYNIELKQANRYKTVVTTELNFRDMVVTITVPDFDHDALVGVVCRHQAPGNFYVLAASKDGWTTIYKFVHDEYEELYGAYHDNVLPSGENIISGICVGNELRLLVNGYEIASVTDDDLLSGDGGVIAQSYKEAPVTVQFKYFYVNPVR